jgi:enoyl-CoA hydratase/carnithine racemase
LTPFASRSYDRAPGRRARQREVRVPQLTLTFDGPVATLLLDPPAGRLGRRALEELAAAATTIAAATDRVHALVVAAAGADFGVGWAPALLEEPPADLLARPPGVAFDALAAVPQPTIAALRGRACSAGLELALACDVRVAEDGARFALADVAAGRLPLGGGTQRLPRAVGRAHALRLLLTAAEIDAAEALRIGLVSELVPDGTATDAALALARTIAARGPIATRLAKEAVLRGVELPLAAGLRAELDLTVILQATADRAEGVRAFTERRPPRFGGR